MVLDHDGTLMFLNDAVGYRETKTSTCTDILRGKEWVEDALFQTCWNTRAGIAKTDVRAIGLCRTYDGNDFARHIPHSITCIGEQVDENLLQLDGVAYHDNPVFWEVQ